MLTVQNLLADVLPLGKEDHLWLRLLTCMPAGQLSFVLCAITECLPSPSTLARWGFSLSKKCPLCESITCTAHHVLYSCPSSLADGQYTWRHDQVLMKLLPFIKRHNPTAAVFADIPNHRTCESGLTYTRTIMYVWFKTPCLRLFFSITLLIATYSYHMII